MPSIAECLRLLRLKDGASLEEVRQAFRKLALRMHPDLNQDDPQAHRRFQRLNEAYMTLKRHLEEEEAKGRGAVGGYETSRKAEPAKESARPGPTASTPPPKPPPKPPRSGGQGTSPGPKGASGPEDFFRDVFKDPYSRKVFDEVYGRVGGVGRDRTPPKRPRPRRTFKLQWGERTLELDFTEGVFSGLKKWLKSLFDQQQTLYLPPLSLRPGNLVRLTIDARMGGKRTLDLVLPPDFVIGRPFRLKGQGGRFGPLRGDLYLRLLAR